MKYNIVVIIFSFDFEGEMSCLVPLFVHEKGCAWKKYDLIFSVSLFNFFKIFLFMFFEKNSFFFKLLPFHIVFFQCCNFFWIFKTYYFEQ
jgi:hypothetical protein